MNVLVIGGCGFLGRNVAKYFSDNNWLVSGAGNDNWVDDEFKDWGFSSWKRGEISLQLLNQIPEVPDVIVHCGGSGSVGFTQNNPHEAFSKTVYSTSAILEFMRQKAHKAKLVYPSSPAVYGAHAPKPMKISDPFNPVSLYGHHKVMAEMLCKQYQDFFDLDVRIIRFFSIYGRGLKKQLFWEASKKLLSGHKNAEFWGTGHETRDFIHVKDAASLCFKTALSTKKNLCLNGASGNFHKIKEAIEILRNSLDADIKVQFNEKTRPGDPIHYQACIDEALSIGWEPMISLESGLLDYARWLKTLND